MLRAAPWAQPWEMRWGCLWNLARPGPPITWCGK